VSAICDQFLIGIIISNGPLHSTGRLLRNGVSAEEIMAGVKKAENLRKERLATMNQLRLLRIVELSGCAAEDGLPEA
jgi:hypothetical protein